MKNLRAFLIAALIMGGVGTQLQVSKKNFPSFEIAPSTLDAMGAPKTLHMMVTETCGACHGNAHLRPAGEFAVNSGADVLAGGISGINPLNMTDGVTPETALILAKPTEGSVIPHGGIKISSTHATIQALRDFVSGYRNGGGTRTINEFDPPASVAPAYKNALGAGQHEIIIARRVYKYQGFNGLRGSSTTASPGNPIGGIYRVTFNASDGSIVSGPTNLTPDLNLRDAMQPSLSLDGEKVTFACLIQGSSNWRICEVNTDGTSPTVTQLTTPRARKNGSGMSNDINPIYLPYLPDGQASIASEAGSGAAGLVFLSDEPGFRDEYDVARTLNLHVSDTVGNVRQIDFNPSHDLSPWLHSSGMLVFTRWEHNEHQGENHMSLFQISASDYETAGTQLFGVFGEHVKHQNRGMTDNSYHEPSEFLDSTFGQYQTNNLKIGDDTTGIISPLNYGKMVARASGRDDHGGSLVGPFFPRLQGARNGTRPTINTMAAGDAVRERDEDVTNLSSVTYRAPRSMVHSGGDQSFVVSMSTLVRVDQVFDSFSMSTETIPVYGNWMLAVTSITATGGGDQFQSFTPLALDPSFNYEDAVPLIVRPKPPKIGKPVDLTQTTGIFTSGTVFDRQSDAQPSGLNASNVSVVRFIRALQFSQGNIDFGRGRNDGIGSQIVGDVPISSDGSFAAEVPANVPLQFQVLDANGAVVVNHKPWLNVQPGALERCVGCHATHNKKASIQTLEARGAAALSADAIDQFHFHQDIQPIFDSKCISCHDSALVQGAAGRDRALSLVGRWTPAGTTESYQTLVGGMGMMGVESYVESQKPRQSKLMWWLQGVRYDSNDLDEHVYPDPEDSIGHPNILSEEELQKIRDWISAGVNFRVVDNDRDRHTFKNLAQVESEFHAGVWPILQTSCMPCHDGSQDPSIAVGAMAMDLDAGTGADDENEQLENRFNTAAARVNFMVPEASPLLRKPLGESKGGMSHVGGEIFTGLDDPNYVAIYQWIVGTNPSLSNLFSSTPVTDLVSVNNFPNPFRDSTSFVYGLTGSAATRVEIKIYSRSGKMVRELEGTTVNSTTIGWNKVDWDGKDENGKDISNDVYFYVLKAEFGDGTKKKFRGKCIKIK